LISILFSIFFSGEFLVEDLVGLKAMRASPGENEGVVVGTVAGVVTRDEVSHGSYENEVKNLGYFRA